MADIDAAVVFSFFNSYDLTGVPIIGWGRPTIAILPRDGEPAIVAAEGESARRAIATWCGSRSPAARSCRRRAPATSKPDRRGPPEGRLSVRNRIGSQERSFIVAAGKVRLRIKKRAFAPPASHRRF